MRENYLAILLIIFLVIVPFLFAYGALDEPSLGGGSPVLKPFESGSNFAKFIKWLFPALLTSAAILATFMIAFAGFQWVTAYGNPSKIEDAKDRIFMAVVGLILALAAYLILNTINPALVSPRLLGGA